MLRVAEPAMLWGLTAAALPLAVHLAHRRSWRPLAWGAMRFLAEVVARRRRRMVAEHLALLLLRSLVLALLAFALSRPEIAPSAPAGGLRREGPVATVLAVDDSPSSAAAGAAAAMRDLGNAWLDAMPAGDAVEAVLLSRPGEAPASGPQAVRTALASLAPGSVASDWPALLAAAQARAAARGGRSQVVLLTDGRADGAMPGDPRWADLQRRSGAAGAAVLAPAAPAARNLAVTGLAALREPVLAGRPCEMSVRVANHGPAAAETLVRLLVDGRMVAERELRAPATGSADIRLLHTFPTAGPWRVEAVLTGAADDLPGDDRRLLSLEVESSVPAVLIGDDGDVAALLPGLAGDVLACTSLPPTRLDADSLTGARIAVLLDTPALEPAAVAALERLVAGGGGVLVALGPRTDPELADRYWYRSGDGFLPAPPLRMANADEDPAPARATATHPALALGAGRPWPAPVPTRWWRLGRMPADANVLARIGGDPLLIERRRGRGRVLLWTGTLDPRWAAVPLVRYPEALQAIALYAAGPRPGQRQATAGTRLAWPLADGEDATRLRWIAPDGRAQAASAGTWEGESAALGPAAAPGFWELRDGADRVLTLVASNPDPAESALAPLQAGDLAGLGEPAPGIARTPAEVATLAGAVQPMQLWPWLLAAVLALLAAEAALTSRSVQAERRAAEGRA